MNSFTFFPPSFYFIFCSLIFLYFFFLFFNFPSLPKDLMVCLDVLLVKAALALCMPPRSSCSALVIIEHLAVLCRLSLPAPMWVMYFTNDEVFPFVMMFSCTSM